jgi:hypothetical protein
LLGNFNAKVGREDIFKLTIGNENLHEITLIMRKHSSVHDDQSFREAGYDNVHYLMVGKVWETIAVIKQRFLMERFNLKKLNEVESKEKYVEVSNRSAALEDLDTEVEINSAWKMIIENINISTKESPGYFELKKHKPWFDNGCSRLLYQKKKASARLSIGNVLEFLCWKWKLYPRVVFQVQIGLSIVLYMRSLLFVESFVLGLSNQHILVRVIPSCFRFAEIVYQESLQSRCSPRYLTSSWGSCTLFIWTRGHVSLRVVNVTWIDLDSLAFILHFLNQF